MNNVSKKSKDACKLCGNRVPWDRALCSCCVTNYESEEKKIKKFCHEGHPKDCSIIMACGGKCCCQEARA